MSKLDSLAWRAGLVFIAYGVRVGVRANCLEALKQCLAYLPVGWKPSSSPLVERLYSIVFPGESQHEGEPRFQLYRDGQQLFCCSDGEQLLERFESDAALYVAEVSPRRVFVHAGVVGWRGSAILIPGKSFAGKTSLVAELVRAGATYYSDEFAVLDSRGFVHPYARPLQLREIREDGGLRQVKCAVEDLGGVAGAIPLPVGLVVLSRFKSNAKWRPRHLSAGQALLGILDNTVSARRAPGTAFKTLKPVVSRSFAVKGARGEAHEVVEWITTNFYPQPIFSASGE